MQIRSFLRRRLHELCGKRKREERAVQLGQRSGDDLATRRALLTGGAAFAGASALASTDARAAPVYVQLGAKNDTTGITTIESRAIRAIMGNSTATNGTGVLGYAQSTAAGGIGVQGIAKGSNGTGVSGTATVGSGAKGVSGNTATGIGVYGNATGNGYGVRGNGGYNGVYGSGGSYGVIGSSSGGYGVYGSGATGVYATGGSGGYGVQAYGGSYGVYASSSGYGVYAQGGTAVFGSGTNYGIYGTTGNPNTPAVFGTNGQYGVMGTNGRTAGVRGDSGYVGVWGEGTWWGFYSIATGTSGENYGFMSETLSKTTGYAGWFKGNVRVEGTLLKNAGSFIIDHPLDPTRKWLQHSFVESPDMMNVYNGNVTTDASGFAVVKLPAYFGALNRDYRYQLTVIGTMAQAIVDREIEKNQFRIRTSQGRVKVSWQVTGIRQDDYAKEHPIKVEVRKRPEHLGTRQFLPKGVNGRLLDVRPTSARSPSDK